MIKRVSLIKIGCFSSTPLARNFLRKLLWKWANNPTIMPIFRHCANNRRFPRNFYQHFFFLGFSFNFCSLLSYKLKDQKYDFRKKCLFVFIKLHTKKQNNDGNVLSKMPDIGKLCTPVSCCCKHYFQQKFVWPLGRKYFSIQKKVFTIIISHCYMKKKIIPCMLVPVLTLPSLIM